MHGHEGGREMDEQIAELDVRVRLLDDEGAVDGREREPPDPIDAIRVYEPSTRPGAPLPHAWIDDEAGNRRPIKDLVAPGRFLLIAGEEGDAWCDAARLIRDEGVPIDAVRIGHLDGDLFDPRSTWLSRREIGREGALLVRPDRFVGWRSRGSADAPLDELAAALGRILARPVSVPLPPVPAGSRG